MANWFTDTFSSESSEDDIVKARSLNITRITGVVVPVLAGIATAIGEVAEKPPFDEVAFQRQLILALVALVAVVTVADILGRSIAAAGQARAEASARVPVGTPLPAAIPAAEVVAAAVDVPGHVVAFRAANADTAADAGEYLFVPTEKGTPRWLPAADLSLG